MGCKLLFAELNVLLATVVKYSFENVSIAESDDSFNVGKLPTLTMECTLLLPLASMILARNACSVDGEILFNEALAGALAFVTGE